ncbi:MAG: Rpn family recombination-promoting nuclease/putative transposase [Albidovulum sp.]|nr:Rpn family recombination-promoting nuclease/putative transposase [Albidovulum sp.]
MNAPSTPHDSFFRALVSNERRAAALLSDHLPESVAVLLAPGFSLERLEGTFVDGTGRKTQCDALFRVRLQTGRRASVCFLLEHKSYSDPAMPLQLTRYMSDVWAAELAGRGSAGELPPIVSLVFYHGRERWRAPASVRAMIDNSTGLGEFAPDFRYVLIDLPSIEPARLSRDPEVCAGLLALAVSRSADLPGETLDLITGGTIDGSEFEMHILSYVVVTTDISLEALEASLRRMKPESWETMMGRLAEAWLEQGRAEGELKGRAEGELKGRAEGELKGRAEGELKGRAEGELKGRAEGELTGRAELLLEQLERRFGELPATVRHRVRRAEVSELRSWAAAVLDASSLDEVLATGSKH